MSNAPNNSARPRPTPKPKRTGVTQPTATPIRKTPVEKENHRPQSTPIPISHGRGNLVPFSPSPLTPLATAIHSNGEGVVDLQSMALQLKALQDELQWERAENQRLQGEQASERVGETPPTPDPQETIRELEDKLKREQQLVARLRASDSTTTRGSRPTDAIQDATIIPRPRGVAGTDYSIQVEMELATSERNSQKYAQIKRGLRDLVLNAQINWELPWGEIPASEKAKLFSVARERHPLLARYENDWATEAIVRRFIKNKRSYHYKNGWLDVPEKYAYLKNNASKRNPAGSRTKRAKAVLAAAKKGKARGRAGGRPATRTVQDIDEEEMEVDVEEEEEIEVDGDDD